MDDNVDLAIRVQNLTKVFKLPHEKTTSLKSALVSGWRKSRTYEKQVVLGDVSFDIKKGEFFGIVGRNGSGKSTLLKLLAGIYTPTKGSVIINGSLTPFIELGVGFNPELTGRENIFLNGALLGFNRKQVASMYKDIVDFAELERFMDQKLKNYSSGMQVRLAFSIAIRTRSDILLLDEVLAVGDISFQKKCYDYFKQLKKDKRTVVLVSHDMSAIEKHCDTAVLIHAGKVIDSGDPKEMAAKYRLLNLPEKEKEKNSSELPELFGDIAIKKVTINGGEEALAREKELLSIDVTYTAKKNKQTIVGISIFASDGNHIAYYDTRDSYKDISEKGGTYRAVCQLPANQFIQGTYIVNIDIYDDDGIYLAKKPDAVRFSIVETGLDKAGMFNLQGTWRVNKL